MVIFFLIILIMYLGIQWGVAELYPKLEDRAQAGDTSGLVNSIFSALAFGALIYTIIQQQIALRYSREDLETSLTELEKSAEAQKRMSEHLSEELRLSHMPLFEIIWEYNKNAYGYKSFQVKFKNLTSPAFKIFITAVSIDESGQKHFDDFSKQISLTDDEFKLLTTYHNSTSLDVLIRYSDMLGNVYNQTVVTQKINEGNYVNIVPPYPILRKIKNLSKTFHHSSFQGGIFRTIRFFETTGLERRFKS